MSFIFGSRQRNWVDPRTRPGYESPFGERSRPSSGLNWQILARQLKKRHPEWKQSEDEIRGELEYQDYLRKKNGQK